MPLEPNRVDYLPMIDRPIVRWPNGARVALWIAPNVEHYEYLPPSAPFNPWPRTPHPDVQQYSRRDYGNRVGFWRMLDVLDRYQVKCSTTLNIGVLSHFPEVAEAMLERDWTFVNHGFYNTRAITDFNEGEELGVLPGDPRSLPPPHQRAGNHCAVRARCIEYGAHPRPASRGGLPLSNRLEVRRPSRPNQGAERREVPVHPPIPAS